MACGRSPTGGPGALRIESRNLNDVSSRYPELRALGPQLGSREAILDGEIVAFDEQGTPELRAPAAAHAPEHGRARSAGSRAMRL